MALQPEDMEHKLSDYSQWDDTYRFIQDRNREYEKSNLGYEILKGIDLSFLIFINNKHQVVWAGNLDHDSGTIGLVPSSLLEFLTKSKELTTFEDPTKKKSGYLFVGYDIPFLITIHPILPSSGKGEVMGAFCAGRLLDRHFFQRIQKMVKLELKPTFPNFKEAELSLSPQKRNDFQNNISVTELNDQFFLAQILVQDLFNKDVVLLETKINRNLRDALHLILVQVSTTLVLVGLVLFLTLFFVLRFYVFKVIKKKSDE